ncbi:hypothetical protein EJP82_03715 [Paenibacillus anaericanus]|uniref:CBM21 domain-containing protein n=1 Tax=Paenibacillus anaericanus TaxID=170367 RepID=A0A433YEE6_9BACL|nr:carbohydrate-binding protein [Paenibacillus anaericanus]RUT48248.1 hypothetical protein EJP82_03715 [Paenibacillus anaericanus]
MRSLKKLVVGLTFFTLIFGLTSLGSLISASAAGNEVSLIDSQITRFYKSGFVGFNGNIEVENLGPTKAVTVHYTTDDVTWYDTSASYVGPTTSSKEKWRFEISTSNSTTEHSELKDLNFVKFAIKYDVNGQTYWDNNGYANYYNTPNNYSPTSIILGEPNLLNSHAYLIGDTFDGSIFVKNVSPNKTVKVVYTTDNWATTQEGYASYNGSANNLNSVEFWNFNFYVPNATEVKYAISLTAGGQTYWDNNYGNNFTVN